VRDSTRSTKPLDRVAVPARGPLSAREISILGRLTKLSRPLADSLEQALRDLNDSGRLSYVGPAGEVREVMRATIQSLAPDADVRAQPWFMGNRQGDKVNPTQSERTRYAVQMRRGNPDQIKDLDELVDALIGKIGRETYASGSKAFHAGTAQDDVWKLTGWVFSVLDEVLPS
jgi:hypothetical protein